MSTYSKCPAVVGAPSGSGNPTLAANQYAICTYFVATGTPTANGTVLTIYVGPGQVIHDTLFAGAYVFQSGVIFQNSM